MSGHSGGPDIDDDEIFATSARLRRELADWLDTLDEEQLDTPSLCGRWTVRDVAGHLTAVVTISDGALLRQALRRRGNLHAANADLAIGEARRPRAELTARLRAAADRRLRPPMVGARGPLTDLLVHQGDMRIPLGLPLRPEPAATVIAVDFLTGFAPGFVPRRRLRGLRLVATDGPLDRGEGAEIRGAMGDLMMAICGRRPPLARLSGSGVALLAARL
jgi:uncharacterized protein (TIGR03083 family)